jgi:zinc transporter 14
MLFRPDSYLGMVLGICVGDLGPTYIFALAGGMFLYIALVNMMSELTAAVEAASKHSIRQTLHVLLLQNTGILSGVACLFLLAKYSDYIHFG